jgi:hypothetical protein
VLLILAVPFTSRVKEGVLQFTPIEEAMNLCVLMDRTFEKLLIYPELPRPLMDETDDAVLT